MKRKSPRLTTTSYALLALLEEIGGEATSYELKQALEKSVENFWQVPHTTAYEEPARLVEGGFLSAKQEPSGRRRKRYSLTEAGREALHAWVSDPHTAPPQVRDEAMLKVFAGADPSQLLQERVDWHLWKLNELRGYLEEVQQAEGWERSERTLITGIAYHEKMLELLDLVSSARDER